MTQAANVAIESSQINSSGVLQVAGGGSGAATLTGILYGNGTSAFTAASQAQALSLIGTLPIANGGTGSTTLTANSVMLGNGTSALSSNMVAPGTSGNVLTSNGTTWTSTAPSGGGVTSLNGQTGAITETSYGSIGSYVIMGYNGLDLNTNSSVAVGTTIAGSTLVYQNGGSGQPVALSGAINGYGPICFPSAFGNTTSAGLSGTWRIMTYSKGIAGQFGQTVYPTVLAVRIS